MATKYSVYCDESAHLENDGQACMTLGAVWCPTDRRKEISNRINDLKDKHRLSHTYEMKWTKISKGKLEFYLDVIDYFFDDDDLHYRGVVADKKGLDHQSFNHTHNDWYYIMYFNLLKVIIDNKSSYKVYLDIKDTVGGEKIRQLHNVLSNNMYDFDRSIIERIQLVRSDEVILLQLCDLLTGALMGENRGGLESEAKKAVIEKIKYRSKYSLRKTTLYMESKFNILMWHPAQTEGQ